MVLSKYNKQPKLWLRNVDNTFVIWPYVVWDDQIILKCPREFHKILVKIEKNNKLPFLDVLVDRKEDTQEQVSYPYCNISSLWWRKAQPNASTIDPH